MADLDGDDAAEMMAMMGFSAFGPSSSASSSSSSFSSTSAAPSGGRGATAPPLSVEPGGKRKEPPLTSPPSLREQVQSIVRRDQADPKRVALSSLQQSVSAIVHGAGGGSGPGAGSGGGKREADSSASEDEYGPAPPPPVSASLVSASSASSSSSSSAALFGGYDDSDDEDEDAVGVAAGQPKPVAAPSASSHPVSSSTASSSPSAAAPARAPPPPPARHIVDLDSDSEEDESEEDEEDEYEGKSGEDVAEHKRARAPRGGVSPAASSGAAALPSGRQVLSHHKTPLTHEAVLGGHERAVTALAIDAAGARVATGGLDFTVRLFDFGSMNADLRWYGAFEPTEGYPVRQLHWHPGVTDKLLVVTSSAQPQVYDKTGSQLAMFVKGYPYIDAVHTKGHKAACTGGWWHPTKADTCLTSSEDGTLRRWNVNLPDKNLEVLKYHTAPNRRALVTACAFSSTGDVVVGAATDGGIQAWDMRAPTARRTFGLRGAHAVDSRTSCVRFFPGDPTDRVLVSRGGDHTLKIWDLRMLGGGDRREAEASAASLAVLTGLENAYDDTDVAFSPDGGLLLTGTSNKAAGGKSIEEAQAEADSAAAATGPHRVRGLGTGFDGLARPGRGDDEDGDGGRGAVTFDAAAAAEEAATAAATGATQGLAGRRGMLTFVSTANWRQVQALALTDKSVIRVAWAAATNQILATTSDAKTHVLFDPELSKKGVIPAVGRRVRSMARFADEDVGGEVITPGTETDPWLQRKARSALKGAYAPRAAPEQKGQGFENKANVMHGFLKDKVRKPQYLISEQDPREALLKFADRPDEFTTVYAKTQPKPVFATDVNEVEVQIAGINRQSTVTSVAKPQPNRR